jgi:hypothetical protein
MPGKRQHFLPAAYLGRFSSDNHTKMRERRVHVVRRRSAGPSQERAENIAAKARLYTLPNPKPGWLEHLDTWGYEQGLTEALDIFECRSTRIDAKAWVRNLVPFVAGLFARGPDLNEGKNNEGRMMAFQEMLAPIMAAEWRVLHYPAPCLTTTDRAFTSLNAPVGNGIAIPIDPRTALLLVLGSSRVIERENGRWTVRLSHHEMDASDACSLNSALAKTAIALVIGARAEDLPESPCIIGTRRSAFASLIHNRSTFDSECHIYDWMRIASALDAGPDDVERAMQEIDLSVISKWYRNPLVVELLFKERTAGGVSFDHTRGRLTETVQ